MLRRKTILTTAALMAVVAVPASAQAGVDQPRPIRRTRRTPPPAAGVTGDSGPYVLERGYGSPDAVDAARDLPAVPATQVGPGPYTDSERALVESPEVQQMVDSIRSEISATPPVVEVRAPSGGFDWGDAGIGAAGMLALFSIAAGSALLLTGRRRRGGFRAATH